LLSATAALLLVSVAAAPLTIQRLDPDRGRKQAEATLARGEPFVFEGDTGLPGPFRWVLGDPGPPRLNPVDGWGTVETLGRGLPEVARDPGRDRYRLQVDVRHDSGAGNSYLGLYFGYRQTSADPVQRKGAFYTLRFAERGNGVRLKRDARGQPLGKPASHVML